MSQPFPELFARETMQSLLSKVNILRAAFRLQKVQARLPDKSGRDDR